MCYKFNKTRDDKHTVLTYRGQWNYANDDDIDDVIITFFVSWRHETWRPSKKGVRTYFVYCESKKKKSVCVRVNFTEIKTENWIL